VITRAELAPELWSAARPSVASKTGFPRLEDMERDHIREALKLTEGRLSEAAEMLGIHRNTLRRKIEEYGLQGS
jgi:DNA-binding NtrC family response regulator